MIGRSPKILLRWTAALALPVLLLAAQQLALLHPLSHLHDEPQPHVHAHAHGQAHDEPAASDAAEAACSLCLACAAASPLATAAPVVTQALACGTPGVAGTVPPLRAARAPPTGHNRGPPGFA